MEVSELVGNELGIGGEMAREGERLVVLVWFRRCRLSLAAALRIKVSSRLGAHLGTRFGCLRGYALTVTLRLGWVHEAL